MKYRTTPEVEARLQRVGRHLLEAARRRWVGHDPMTQKVESINALLPLRLYFLEVGRYICSRKMDAQAALHFRDNLAYPDALELIFEDAGRVMLADDFASLDSEDLRLFLTLRGAVKWIMDAAYHAAASSLSDLTEKSHPANTPPA